MLHIRRILPIAFALVAILAYSLNLFQTMTGPGPHNDELSQIANTVLQPKGLRVASYKILQRLWAGYGNICHIEAIPIDPIDDKNQEGRHSFILKHVTPPSTMTTTPPSKDEGHLRKLISYQVEQYFYTQLSPSLPPNVSVAECIGSTNDSGEIALLLSDLREDFPIAGEKRGELGEKQVFAALDWLAEFHGFWWTRNSEIREGGLRLPPREEGLRGREGVWLNGGYTYLATRRKEYATLKDDTSSEWSLALCQPVHGTNKSIAELVAQVLAPDASGSADSSISNYETLIHGDVKSENLFTDASGSAVAFFDFQYVGLGLGVCDLAKLFTCSVPLEMLTEQNLSGANDKALGIEQLERKFLEYYMKAIRDVSGKEYPWEKAKMHWDTALVDWLRFQASWGFWGNTEWLEARARYILRDEKWLKWLLDAAGETHVAD